MKDPLVLVCVLGHAEIDLMHIPLQSEKHLWAFSGLQFVYFHWLDFDAVGRPISPRNKVTINSAQSMDRRKHSASLGTKLRTAGTVCVRKFLVFTVSGEECRLVHHALSLAA